MRLVWLSLSNTGEEERRQLIFFFKFLRRNLEILSVICIDLSCVSTSVIYSHGGCYLKNFPVFHFVMAFMFNPKCAFIPSGLFFILSDWIVLYHPPLINKS